MQFVQTAFSVSEAEITAFGSSTSLPHFSLGLAALGVAFGLAVTVTSFVGVPESEDEFPEHPASTATIDAALRAAQSFLFMRRTLAW